MPATIANRPPALVAVKNRSYKRQGYSILGSRRSGLAVGRLFHTAGPPAGRCPRRPAPRRYAGRLAHRLTGPAGRPAGLTDLGTGQAGNQGGRRGGPARSCRGRPTGSSWRRRASPRRGKPGSSLYQGPREHAPASRGSRHTSPGTTHRRCRACHAAPMD